MSAVGKEDAIPCVHVVHKNLFSGSVRDVFWESEPATIFRRWSVFVVVLHALFWLGYWCVKGYVPDVNGISRWWDVLAGPIFLLSCFSLLGMSYRVDTEGFLPFLSFIGLSLTAIVAFPTLYKDGMWYFAPLCMAGAIGTFFLCVAGLLLVFLGFSLLSIPIGGGRNLGKWLSGADL